MSQEAKQCVIFHSSAVLDQLPLEDEAGQPVAERGQLRGHKSSSPDVTAGGIPVYWAEYPLSERNQYVVA